jgi:inner membrane protein
MGTCWSKSRNPDNQILMSPVTHFLSGWVLANCVRFGRKDRILATLACVIPDIDGLGIIPELLTRNSSHPLLWFTLYHHSLHNLEFALVVAALSFAFATRKWATGLLALLSFHLHLLEDLIGSRGPDGYQWPIPYLQPFSSSLQLSWRGEWGLNAWPNVVITIALLLITLWLAWHRGFSPLEMISVKADASLVAALRQRFPNERGTNVARTLE